MSEHNGHNFAPVPGKIPGAALNLGGVELIAPPFNLDAVQEVMPLLVKFKETKTAADTLRAVAPILLLSLRRNYPEITLKQVLELVDMGNAVPALLDVCKVSGIEFAKNSGESAPTSP